MGSAAIRLLERPIESKDCYPKGFVEPIKLHCINRVLERSMKVKATVKNKGAMMNL